MGILGMTMAQLMSTGMYTWQTGEMRRGAYERAQFIFDRMARDLATLYPHNSAMPEAWVFQADTLFSDAYDGTGNDAVGFTHDNIALMEDDGVRHLKPTDLGSDASITYEFELPFDIRAAVVQPKITLSRADDCHEAKDYTCRVIVQAAQYGVDLTDPDVHKVAEFRSGLQDQTITPNIDITEHVRGHKHIQVKITIAPANGKESDARLFEAKVDDPIRPVFRFAASPRECGASTALISDYRDDRSQYIVFTRWSRGIEQVAYFVHDKKLYRVRSGSGGSSLFDAKFSTASENPIAEGIVYFGCKLQNQYETGGPDEEQKRRDAEQLYWREADSVPPYVRVTVVTVPLSGSRTQAIATREVSPADTEIRVDSTRGFVIGMPANQFIRIDDEWISYAALTKNTFTGCNRGQRGTLPAKHNNRSHVIGAETFSVDVPIPAWGYRKR